MKLNLTHTDWLKLNDWNNILAKEIQQSLPFDWQLTLDEISSYIFDTYISLAKLYKEGAMSFTSYCYRYTKQYTLRKLLIEYRRLKAQENDFDISEIKNKETNLSTKLFCKDLIEKMPKLDQMIATRIMEGYSYEEIAKEIGLSKMAITKRMRKYGK